MGEKKGDSNITTVILKVDIHCDGCASKIIRHLRSLQGVDTVKAESETGKITVTGNVDPTKLRDNLEKKIKKKVELISPQLNKENNKDTKTSNKSDKEKIEDKKDKEETVTTAVLKVALHCQGCIESIGKTVKKTKGVEGMSIDKEKETVTVKGTMDVKSLVNNLTERLKRKVEVVPPKKDKKKEEKEGDNNQNENLEQSRIEYNMVQLQHQPPYGFGYGYGGYGNSGGYNYGPVYPEQFHVHMHAQPPPPQMFSDENPNACSLM